MSFSTAVLGAASIPSASRKQASGPAAPRQTYIFNWEKLWLGALVLGLLVVLLVAIALPVGTLLGHSFVSVDGQFSGLAQFMAYARMPGVGRSLFNSLWLSALSSTLCVALAYGYA